MQNSITKKFESKKNDLLTNWKKLKINTSHLFFKLKVAYQILKSKKGFVSIENDLHSYNMTAEEIFESSEIILKHMGEQVAENARIDKAVHDLVYSN